jgi:hypothetical protein
MIPVFRDNPRAAAAVTAAIPDPGADITRR